MQSLKLLAFICYLSWNFIFVLICWNYFVKNFIIILQLARPAEIKLIETEWLLLCLGRQ